MSKSKKYISTQEFAEKAGISTATVTKWLRSGKLKGRKDGGRWLVIADQSPPQSPSAASPSAAPAKAIKTAAALPRAATAAGPSGRRFYSIEEFSAMTYLTPFGVQQWLKDGRLKGEVNATGQWHVDAVNLEDPNIQRLARKKD